MASLAPPASGTIGVPRWRPFTVALISAPEMHLGPSAAYIDRPTQLMTLQWYRQRVWQTVYGRYGARPGNDTVISTRARMGGVSVRFLPLGGTNQLSPGGSCLTLRLQVALGG